MHWTAIYSLFPDALWLSDYYAIQRANRKAAQLDIAACVGFRVPMLMLGLSTCPSVLLIFW